MIHGARLFLFTLMACAMVGLAEAGAQVPARSMPEALRARLAEVQARVAAIEGEATDEKHADSIDLEAWASPRAELYLVVAEVLRWAAAAGLPLRLEMASPREGDATAAAPQRCEASVRAMPGSRLHVCTPVRGRVSPDGRLQCALYCATAPVAGLRPEIGRPQRR
jgi:hypothetical protein